MSYADHFASHLRLTILRVLAEAPQFTANSSILKGAAQELGLPATRDRIKTELAWLQEQGLVQTHQAADLVVATATERGRDVAEGFATVPGVQRPGS